VLDPDRRWQQVKKEPKLVISHLTLGPVLGSVLTWYVLRSTPAAGVEVCDTVMSADMYLLRYRLPAD